MLPIEGWIRDAVVRSERLRAVPVPVIEEVVHQAVMKLLDDAPPEFTVEDLAGAVPCEACGELAREDDVRHDEEGLRFCVTCDAAMAEADRKRGH